LALILSITANIASVAHAQQPANAAADTKNADILKAIDQLLQQNGKLEQQNHELEEQNRELIERINSLLPSAANKVPGTAPQPAPQSAAQGSTQTKSNGDDKAEFPEASAGNEAIFGEFNPGRGFTVGQGKYGKLDLSGYMVTRYLNQLPGSQSATDHLGRPVAVAPRQDFQFHRVMLFSQGWLFSPKFQYSTFVWTVQDTNQVAVGGALYYAFGKYMTLGGGWNAYPGTMSLQGSHPYWESYDRVMADEFFRPYFSQGVFAQGNLLPGKSASKASVQVDGRKQQQQLGCTGGQT
jgi:hypothetical protein